MNKPIYSCSSECSDSRPGINYLLAVQLRIETEQQALDSVERAANIASKRVTAGKESRLDGNLAIVEAERARNQLAALNEQRIGASAQGIAMP